MLLLARTGLTTLAVAGRGLNELLGLTRRIATRHQGAQWLEEVVRKLVPVEPGPAFALLRFTDLRRTVLAVCQYKHSDVVPALRCHDVVCVRAKPRYVDV